MRDYGKIKTTVWSDDKVREAMTSDDRVLFFYLLSSPHTTALGCFYCPGGYIMEDLCWEPERVKDTQDRLDKLGVALWDRSGWVWLPRFLRHNKPENAKVWQHVRGLAAALPQTVSFRDRVIEAIPNRTVSQSEPQEPETVSTAAHQAELQETDTVSKSQEEEKHESHPNRTEPNRTEPNRTEPSKRGADAPKHARKLVDDSAAIGDEEFVRLAEKCGKSLVDEIPRWRDWQANAPKPSQRSPRDERAQLRNWLRSDFGDPRGTDGPRPDRPRTGTEALRRSPEFRAAAARLVGAAGGGNGPPDAAPAAAGAHGGDDRPALGGGREIPGRTLPQPAGIGGGPPAGGDAGAGDVDGVSAAVGNRSEDRPVADAPGGSSGPRSSSASAGRDGGGNSAPTRRADGESGGHESQRRMAAAGMEAGREGIAGAGLVASGLAAIDRANQDAGAGAPDLPAYLRRA